MFCFFCRVACGLKGFKVFEVFQGLQGLQGSKVSKVSKDPRFQGFGSPPRHPIVRGLSHPTPPPGGTEAMSPKKVAAKHVSLEAFAVATTLVAVTAPSTPVAVTAPPTPETMTSELSSVHSEDSPHCRRAKIAFAMAKTPVAITAPTPEAITALTPVAITAPTPVATTARGRVQNWKREGKARSMGLSSRQFETVALAKAQKRAARQLKELPPDLSVKQAVAEWNRRAAAPYIAAQARDKLREINEMIQAGKEEAGGEPKQNKNNECQYTTFIIYYMFYI